MSFPTKAPELPFVYIETGRFVQCRSCGREDSGPYITFADVCTSSNCGNECDVPLCRDCFLLFTAKMLAEVREEEGAT